MSVNYSEWSIEKTEVENLQLDPQNPRLSEIENPTQEKIIEQLVQYEDVLGLAIRISERGFLPSEVLIAHKERYNLCFGREPTTCCLQVAFKSSKGSG